MESAILFYTADIGFARLRKRKKFKISYLFSIAFLTSLNKLWYIIVQNIHTLLSVGYMSQTLYFGLCHVAVFWPMKFG